MGTTENQGDSKNLLFFSILRCGPVAHHPRAKPLRAPLVVRLSVCDSLSLSLSACVGCAVRKLECSLFVCLFLVDKKDPFRFSDAFKNENRLHQRKKEKKRPNEESTVEVYFFLKFFSKLVVKFD